MWLLSLYATMDACAAWYYCLGIKIIAVTGWTVARLIILAQATLSRLGETCRGQTLARARALAQAEGLSLSEALSCLGERHSPKRERVWARGVSLQCSLSEGPHLWARSGLAQAREGSPKRVRENLPGPLSRSRLSEGLSLKRGNSSHLSEGFWLERDALWAALFSPLGRYKFFGWLMCFKYEVWEMAWNICGMNWIDNIGVTLACKVNEMDVIEMAMVLVWDETLYSRNWWMRWHGSTWNTNGMWLQMLTRGSNAWLLLLGCMNIFGMCQCVIPWSL